MIYSQQPPIPESVRAGINQLLPGIRKKSLKGMICPAGGFSASLLTSGFLTDQEIVGFLDNDKKKQGTYISGLPVHAIECIESNVPDFVIVASLSFSKEIVQQLRPLSRKYHFKILDISIPDSNLHKTLPFMHTRLEPYPEQIIDGLMNRLRSLKTRGVSVLLYSTHSAVTNLWMRGLFAGIDVVGIVDNDLPRGSDCHGLKVYHCETAALAGADAIVVADIGEKPNSFPPGVEIIQLYEGLCMEDLRNAWSRYLEKIIWVNRLQDFPCSKVQVWMRGKSLGETLCAISAARDFARKYPDLSVECQQLPEILDAYGDNLVRPGNSGYVIPNQADRFLAERDQSIACNYQGCFHLGLGMNFCVAPKPELPLLPAIEGLAPRSYIAVCPGVQGAEAIPFDEQMESIIDNVQLPVYCIGDGATRCTIQGMDYSLLGSPLQSLRVIQHAAAVLTPRSAAAHISAGYDVPAIVWESGDSYDWHTDYPFWNARRIRPFERKFVDIVAGMLEELLFAPKGSSGSDSLTKGGVYSNPGETPSGWNCIIRDTIEIDA